MKLLVTGGEGQMGRALRTHFPDAVYLGSRALDVRDRGAVARTMRRLRPTVVLHAAAITDHQCPDDNALIETNILGTRTVANAAYYAGARLIYLSTHYVYPCEDGGYRETDHTRPVGTYAWTKRMGESYAREDTLVIRGSWYTPEKVAGWKVAFTDAFTSREPIADAATKIATLLLSGARGIVNIGGKHRSFYEIARDQGAPIAASRLDWRGPYVFPRDSGVDTSYYQRLCPAS